MKTITYTYNEKSPTNKDLMIAALTGSIDDGGAYYEGVVEYNIDCPYYSDSDCLNEHEGNKCGTAAYSAGCVRCKLSWLNREFGTYPSNDGRWEISGGRRVSVLIKGMSGCKCCADCEFCGGLIMPDDIYVCDCPPTRGMDITMAIEEDCKHPDCPLAELPEKHGRLIDESIALEMIRKSMGIKDLSFLYHAEKSIVNEIYHAPTVIEAEGEE